MNDNTVIDPTSGPEHEAARLWFERLAGRGAALSDPAEEREIQLLRSAIVRVQARVQAQEEAMTDAAADERRRRQFMEAAFASGLLRGSPAQSAGAASGAPAAAARRGASRPTLSGLLQGRAWAWLGGLAVAMGVVVVAGLHSNGSGSDPSAGLQVTGARYSQEIHDPDPARKGRALAGQLTAAKVPVELHDAPPGVVLDVDLTAQTLDAARPILASAGVDTAVAGRLQLRVVP